MHTAERGTQRRNRTCPIKRTALPWSAFSKLPSDLDTLEDLVHDDYVAGYPQSGARVPGKHHARANNENYPGQQGLVEHSYVLSGISGL